MEEWNDAVGAARGWLALTFGDEVAGDGVRRSRAVLGGGRSGDASVFSSLVAHLAGSCSVGSPVELEVAAAVLLFGARDLFGRRYEPIPDRHWERLLALVGEVRTVQPKERAVGVVIAYGRGWRRPTTGGDWDGRWALALPALKALVAQSATLFVARDLVAGWGIDPATFPSVDVEAWSSRVALELDRGLCRCSKRTDGCLRPAAHTLSAWDPQACRLQAFLRQALRGSNQPLLLPGFLSQGMLARALEEECGIIVGQVATWVCSSEQAPEHEHEGAWCGRCRRWMDQAVDCRRPRKRIFVKGGFPHGTHLQVEFFRCETCDHLCTTRMCARCHRKAQRRRTVWVPQAGDVVEFVDLESLAEPDNGG